MVNHQERSQNREPFAEAANQWDLARLYRDLTTCLERLGESEPETLTKLKDATNSTHLAVLRGLLLGENFTKIGNACSIDSRSASRYACHLDLLIERLVGKRPEENDIRGVLSDYRKLVNWFPPPPKPEPFYGREQELQKLTQWIVGDRCRLIVLYGTGGMGKTWLMSQLARQVAPNFEGGSWQHLDGSPRLEEVLARLQRSTPGLPGQPTIESPSLESRIDWLVEFLGDRRYLLVFDGIQEDLLHHQEKWPDYKRLFQRLEAMDLQGCVVVISREKLRDLRQLDIRLTNNQLGKVRSSKLGGLETPAAEQLLARYELGDRDLWGKLITADLWNPLHLRIVAAMIQEQEGGDISRYLSSGTRYMGSLRDILKQAWDCLDQNEKAVLKKLAETPEPASKDVIRSNCSEYSSDSFSDILQRLSNKCLVESIKESGSVLYYLQAYIKHFVSKQPFD
jgi:NB-ARC domain